MSDKDHREYIAGFDPAGSVDYTAAACRCPECGAWATGESGKVMKCHGCGHEIEPPQEGHSEDES